MANQKISAMSAATTPLAGTELVPLVQGGGNAQTAATDVAATLATIDGDTVTAANASGLTLNASGTKLYLSVAGDGSGTDGVFVFSNDVTGSNDSALAGLSSGTTAAGASGSITVQSGNSSGGISGDVQVNSGTAGTNSGQILINTGDATGNSGNITLAVGSAGGTAGNIILSGLPTSSVGLPSGALWIDVAAGRVIKSVA